MEILQLNIIFQPIQKDQTRRTSIHGNKTIVVIETRTSPVRKHFKIEFMSLNSVQKYFQKWQ